MPNEMKTKLNAIHKAMCHVLKLEEASSLPRLDVCLMKKMAWVL